jgi:hypothetical protein
MEVMLGNRRLKMIDGKVCIVKLSKLGVDVKSGRFTPIKFSDKDGYNICNITINGRVTMLREHRLVWKLAYPNWDIFDSSQDNFIDHKNRNRRDNRLENLHVVNHQQNNWNRDAKGCYFDKRRGNWQAYIKINGVQKHLGRFSTEEEAHASYLEAKKKYHPILYNELQ